MRALEAVPWLWLAASCGGKAVIDDAPDGGGTTTVTTTSSSTSTTTSEDPCGLCDRAPIETAGALDDRDIDEASGIAASARHAGVFYVHNDSGDAPRFWAIDVAGQTLTSWQLASATATDWEDVAVGPCPTGSCIYFGDIGDNNEVRPSYEVYRVPEPELDAPSVSWERIRFVYPDGSHNAETLLVDGDGRLYVVTKVAAGPSGIYAFPSDPPTSGTITLAWVGGVEPPFGDRSFTAGDAGERGILMRTYAQVFFHPWRGDDVAQTLAGEPCAWPTSPELQGEAIAWRGTDYLTVAEAVGAAVYLIDCAP